MKKSDIMIFLMLVFWVVYITMILSIFPTNPMELAAETCAPFGGVKSIAIEKNGSVRFECVNGELHIAERIEK